MLTYVKADANDAETVFSQAEDLVLKYEDLEKVDLGKVMAWVKNKIFSEIENYTKICQDGVTVGFFRVISSGDKAELDDFYILEEYRGRGIGTKVLEKICAETPCEIFLYVFLKNTGAIRLYEKFGFVPAETVGSTRMIMRRLSK